MIEQSSIDDLKNRLDIVDTISNYVELKKNGANFKACCPFHSEKTPSFVVSPTKQIYHCFGCGAGGDSIKFVMEIEHLSYPEALEKLASENNFTLRYSDKKEQKEKKEIIAKLNNFFQKKYEFNNKAKEYIKQRGIYDSSVEKFEIGYAPSNSEVLNFFKENMFNLEELKEVGVIAFNEKGNPYSRFIERITFPIYSQSAKIVGFGGRTISNHPAKYINSPATKFFNKSKLLYGYHLAKDKIFKQNEIIITEGYLDVIMLHQAGFSNAVATLGTALTNEHIPLIKKSNPTIILAYDGDNAGIEAALKASKMLSATKAKGGVILFEEGLDPADMVKNGQINKLKSLFSHPKPFIEFVLEQIIKKYDISNPLQKDEALKEAKIYLSSLSKLLQGEYRGFLASLLHIDENFIRVKTKTQQQNNQKQKYEDIAELQIIKTLLSKQKLIDTLLDIIDIKIFKTHNKELKLLLQNQKDSSELVGLSLREDIKELNEDELLKQIKLFLIKHYENELKKIKNAPIDYKEKNFTIRKIRENLEKLRKSELLSTTN